MLKKKANLEHLYIYTNSSTNRGKAISGMNLKHKWQKTIQKKPLLRNLI